MGEDGKTIPVEPLKLESEDQKRRYKSAEKRRESRKALVEATKGS
jgi:acyl-CoA hydrolase